MAPGRLRVVTLNLWNEQGPHRERLRLVVEGLRVLDPDVVALQEVRERDGLDNQAESLGRALSLNHVFAPAAEWGGGIEGLAILSRHPITDHVTEPLPAPDGRRAVLGARMAAPDGEVWAVSTHLSYRPAEGIWRERQVVAVDAFCQRLAGGATTLLCGDFNAEADSDEIRFLRGRATLAGRRAYWQDAMRRSGGQAAVTWAARNPYTATQLHLEPDRRIDYVFVSPARRDGVAEVLDAEVVLDQPDPRGIWPSDHFAVLADIATTPKPGLDLPSGKRY